MQSMSPVMIVLAICHILREEFGPIGAHSTRMSAFPVTLLEVGNWLHRRLGLWHSFGASSSGSWYRSHKAQRAEWANLKRKLESECSEGPNKEMHERVFEIYPHLKGVKKILAYMTIACINRKKLSCAISKEREKGLRQCPPLIVAMKILKRCPTNKSNQKLIISPKLLLTLDANISNMFLCEGFDVLLYVVSTLRVPCSMRLILSVSFIFHVTI